MVQALGLRVEGLGFWGLEFRVSERRFRVCGRILDLGLWVQGEFWFYRQRFRWEGVP